MEVFDTYGADAMRWYLLSSPILRGNDFSVSEEGIRDTVRHTILPLWNAWYFLSLYANAAGTSGSFRVDQTDVLDRYLLGELHHLVVAATTAFDEYDLSKGCDEISRFIETLTNWYIRRSRDRFWRGEQDAIDTLHTALVTVCQVAAPLLPLISEHIYRGLTAADASPMASVHLADWPDAEQFPVEPALGQGMDLIRSACSTVLALRKSEGLRVRLPLREVVIASRSADLMAPHIEILKDEVNVKQVVLTDDVDTHGEPRLTLNPGRLGPRLGAATQQVIAAYRQGEWTIDDDGVTVGGIRLEPGEYEFSLEAAEGAVSATLPAGSGIVVLDTELTPELEREGLARDLIRLIQQERRAAGFDVSDRIELVLRADQATLEAFEAHRSLVMEETLALGAVTVVVPDSIEIEVARTVAG
jgi:isoleucyl-tRNA synthetase